MPRTRQAMKQRWPAATDDGMNDDAVLVDEPQLLERSRELGRSDEDTALGLRFQRRDRLAKVALHLDRVPPRKVAPRARHDELRLRLELLCPLAPCARRLFVACHRGPGSLHQLVGVAPEEHRPALIHELRPIVVQLVVHDPLGVIDAPVQSHVETEGEEAHGVGLRVLPKPYLRTPRNSDHQQKGRIRDDTGHHGSRWVMVFWHQVGTNEMAWGSFYTSMIASPIPAPHTPLRHLLPHMSP